MIRTKNAGEALKVKIKQTSFVVELKQRIMQDLEHEKTKTPMDYTEVLGLLVSPFFGSTKTGTGILDDCLRDIKDITMQVLCHREEEIADGGDKNEDNKDTTLTSLTTLYLFLNRLKGLSKNDDHLFTIADLHQANRWDELTTQERKELLDMYVTANAEL